MAILRTAMATLANPFLRRPDAPPGPSIITGRHLDRFPVSLFDSRNRRFRLDPSRSRHPFVLDRVIKVALEMVRVKNHRSTSNPRRIRRQRSRGTIFRPRPFLLTRNEAAFFNVLSAVVGHHYLISCKVRLADLVTCAERDWRRGHANRIAQKHVDFVVTHVASSRIVAAIELDDRTHAKPERRLRDAFLNDLFRQMRIRLIRVPASWRYDPETVAGYLTRAGLKVSENTAEMKKPRQ